MNFSSSARTSELGWEFHVSKDDPQRRCAGSSGEPEVYHECDYAPSGQRDRHPWGCWGCLSHSFWFQNSGTWNAFYPDKTYGYWRIGDSSVYNQRWPAYDSLEDGDPMPGFGMYVR